MAKNPQAGRTIRSLRSDAKANPQPRTAAQHDKVGGGILRAAAAGISWAKVSKTAKGK